MGGALTVTALFLDPRKATRAMYRMGGTMRHDNRGFTLIELMIVVVIIGMLATIVVPKFAHGKDRSLMAVMKTDLRNLVGAQEAYYSVALNYYNGAIPDPAFAYGPSENVTVTLSAVTSTGWQASATHTSTLRTCAIFVGSAAPLAPATVEGVAACTP
jgi:prepilin-type N-terminal cleavage/methylation domain-containing protein